MHIAFFCSGWPESSFPGGIIKYVTTLRSELIKQGHRVSIVTANRSPNCDELGIYLINPSFKQRLLGRLKSKSDSPEFDAFGFEKLIAECFRRLHKHDPIDLIEMEESFGWFRAVEKQLKVPMVVRLHGPLFLAEAEENKLKPFIRARIEREGRALSTAMAITAPSRCTLSDSISYYGLNPNLSCCIRNPLTAADSMPLWNAKTCQRNSILFVGRFDLIKGGDVVLQAFAQLLEKSPKLQLVFVGEDRGIPLNGEYLSFNEYASKLFSPRQRENITFHGVLSQSEICQLRTKAAVSLVASVWESGPYTALESMIQSCPVVAINNGGVGEIIEDGVTGLLATHGDLNDLCDKIMTVITQLDLSQDLGLRGRQYVLRDHSPETITRQTADFYHETLSMFVSSRV